MFIVPPPLTAPWIVSSPPVEDARAPLFVASIVPLLTTDPTITPSPSNERPFSTRMLPAGALPDVPMSTNDPAPTLSVEPLQIAIASETRSSPPVATAIVPSPPVGPISDPPSDRSVIATVPVLIWIEPAGTSAVSTAAGGLSGDQLVPTAQVDEAVAVQVNVVPAMTQPPREFGVPTLT